MAEKQKKGIFKKILGTVAPMIGTAIGGPFGGMATQVLKQAFGTDDMDQIEMTIAAGDPQALAQLKLAEVEMKAKMKELDIAEQDLYLKDTQDARSMAKAVGIWPQIVLTGLAITLFGGTLYFLMVKAAIIPTENKDLVILMVGQLSALVGQGFAFFLGTTKSSGDKNVMIAAQKALDGSSR